jgi:Beta-propeller repeat
MAPLSAHPTCSVVEAPPRKHARARAAAVFTFVAALVIVVVLVTPLVATAGAALTFSTYYGGSGADSGKAIAVDSSGNIYVAVGGPGTGTPGTIVKYSPDGQSILYAAPLGDMAPVALAVDATGNAYVAATCPYPRSGLTFNCPTMNSLTSGQPQAQGDSGGYVLKLSPTGALLFSTSLGGVGSVQLGGIAVDPAGNIYVGGFNAYGGFPTTRPPFAKPGVTAGPPAFVAAIAADTSRFLYFVEFLLSGGTFQPTALAVDRTGAAYVYGGAGAQFPTTPGAFQAAPNSGPGAPALAKISPDASTLVYATYFGSSGMSASGVAVDGDGNAYISGGAGPGLPTVNALQPTFAGGATDAFVARLDPTGSSLMFSTYLGGSGDDEAAGLALDSSANIYVAGTARSTNFPQVSPLPAAQGSPISNFIAQLTSDGRSLVYSTYFADSQTCIGDVAASPTGTAYVTGTTFSTAYPTVRPTQATYGGGNGDAFVAKLEPSSVRVFITSPADGSTVSGTVWTDVWAENYVGTSNTYTLSIGNTVLATGTAQNHATLAWDSGRVADGPQTLTATVRDSAGHVGSTTRALVVRNGTSPTLVAAFTSPGAGATVSGTVTVGMNETGASGTPITFTLTMDGTQIFTATGTATTASFAWNTSSVTDGATRSA